MQMKIAIDCRYIGKSGIGRVCEGILDNLDEANEYFLVGDPNKLKNYNRQVIEDLTNPFSKKGLFCFTKKINKLCDCIIIPNFIIPFGIKIPVFSIIHDLIFLDLKVSTTGIVDSLIKKYLLKRCVKKSVKIDCVSNFTLERCEHYYPKHKNKFFVAYNGLSKDILQYNSGKVKKENKIVYVGNVKPHKGIQTLLAAYEKLPKTKRPILKIIGEKDNFLNGLKVDDIAIDGVVFTGKLSNAELFKEIESARFLISPSLYEGFGLPPLEALYLGTKPIISDIPVHKEIYSQFDDVVFFKCGDGADLSEKIKTPSDVVLTDQTKIKDMFNYEKTAKEFFSQINKCFEQKRR